MDGINTDTIALLNRLIQSCQDGANGYRDASAAANSPALKEVLMELSQEREFMVTDLQGEITSLGGEPNEGGSIAGAFQRGWMNLRAAVTGGIESDVLDECQASEEVAIRHYQEALTANVPPLTRTLLQRHYEQLADASRRLRTLELAAS